MQTVVVHGERDDLWWEFALSASFRWQAHLSRLAPAEFRRRQALLVRELGLAGLLERPVALLTPAQRALANLALGLLAEPQVLVWVEPFALLAGADRERAVRLLRRLQESEALTVVALSERRGALEPWDTAPRLRAAR